MKKSLFSLPVNISQPVLMQFYRGSAIQLPSGEVRVLMSAHPETVVLFTELAKFGKRCNHTFADAVAAGQLTVSKVQNQLARQMARGTDFAACRPVVVTERSLHFGGIYHRHPVQYTLNLWHEPGNNPKLMLYVPGQPVRYVRWMEAKDLLEQQQDHEFAGLPVGGCTLKWGEAVGERAPLLALLREFVARYEAS